jgi:hypothetical protein
VTSPSQLLAASIGKEALYGVPVAPTYSLPVLTCEPVDNHQPIGDQHWRGAPATTYAHAPGMLSGAVKLGGPVYADTIGFALAGVLGDVAFTAGTPNTAAMALLNSGAQQPPSYTIYSADGLNCLCWAGCKFSDLTISSTADGTLTWTATAASTGSSIVTAPARNYTAATMFAGWRGVIQIGGVTETRVLSSDLTISRVLVPQRNTDGARSPFNIRTNEITVSGSLTLAMAADTYRQQYIAGTPSSLDITYAQGAGAGLQQVKLHCSSITWQSAPRVYGGDWVELDLSWTADANTSDVGLSGGYSPLLATLKNTVATGVYA